MNKLKTALKSTTVLLVGLLLIFIAGYKTSADSSFSAGKYYYSQLDDKEKALYQLFYSKLVSNGKCKELSSNPTMTTDISSWNMSARGTGTVDSNHMFSMGDELKADFAVVQNNIKSKVSKAYYAFSNDYAVVFWPTGYKYTLSLGLSEITQSGGVYTATVTATTLNVTLEETYDGEVNLSNIQTFNSKVDTVYNDLKSGLPSGASDYDKIKTIHDYLCTRLVYVNTQRAHTAEGAFYGENKAVCEGYAEAFQILAERFGLTSVMVSGEAYNSSGTPEGHKWNMLQMEDGKWYLVDVTWDDQSSKIYYTYMLSGKNSSGFNNTQGNERYTNDHLTYPTWNATAYTKHTHKLVLVPAKAPTCDEDGYEAYYKCSGCNRMFSDANGDNPITAPVVIPKLGHEWDEGTVTTEPGCETEGVKTFHCTRDGCTGTKTEPVAPLGHDLVWKDAEPATCDTDGHEGYYECSRCHKLYSDADGKNEISAPVIIPATGHDMEFQDGKTPTCTEDGWDAYFKCKKCNKLFSDAFGKNEISAPVVLNKLGHDLRIHAAKAATCTEDGHELYYECDRCHKLFSDANGQNEISEPVAVPKTGHSLELHNAKAATCDTNGHEAYYECSKCHKLFSDADGKNEISEPVAISKLGHDLKFHAEKAPTKTEPGNIAYYECQRCYKLFSDKDGKNEISKADIVIPATGHDLTKVPAKAAKCTEDGNIEYYICKDTDCGCGKCYSDPYGQHEISKASTVIHATGHNIVEIPAKDATCDEDGYESHYKCDKCGKLYSDADGKNEISAPVAKPKLGHEWDEGTVTTEPGCETEGVKTFHCTRDGCKKTKTQKIDPLGHDPEHYDAKEPTYKEGGWNEHYLCKRCGKRFSDKACKNYLQDSQVLLPKLGSAVLGEEAEVNGFNYRVTNPAEDGTGGVYLIGVATPTATVVIPGTVEIKGNTYKVTRVAANAFFGDTTVKTVTIGVNVLAIEKNAFYGCSNLVKVSGGGRLRTIGINAFARCPKLSSFTITSTALYSIGSQAFYKDSRLKTIYIKNTTKLTKSGVKKSLKGSSVKTVKVKKSKVKKYKKYFTKKNCGRKVKVKK